MIPYSLHVALLLAICLLFYKLLLQKETYYRLNRVILLTCLVLAFVLPLIPVPRQFSLRADTPVIAPANIATAPIANEDYSVNERLQAEATTKLIEQVKPQATVKAEAAAKPIAAKPQTVTTIAKQIIPTVPVMTRILKWAFWLYWCVVVAFGANLLLQIAVLLYQA